MLNLNSKSDNIDDCITLTAPTTHSVQLWVEAICAVQEQLSFTADNRASSAKIIIYRYRFNTLQSIIIHLRHLWIVPLEIMKKIAGYLTAGKMW